MKEVLPQFLAPMTRMLGKLGLVWGHNEERRRIAAGTTTHLNGVGSFLLRTRRGLLMPVALMALLA